VIITMTMVEAVRIVMIVATAAASVMIAEAMMIIDVTLVEAVVVIVATAAVVAMGITMVTIVSGDFVNASCMQ
jgi:hypothetical protein